MCALFPSSLCCNLYFCFYFCSESLLSKAPFILSLFLSLCVFGSFVFVIQWRVCVRVWEKAILLWFCLHCAFSDIKKDFERGAKRKCEKKYTRIEAEKKFQSLSAVRSVLSKQQNKETSQLQRKKRNWMEKSQFSKGIRACAIYICWRLCVVLTCRHWLKVRTQCEFSANQPR